MSEPITWRGQSATTARQLRNSNKTRPGKKFPETIADNGRTQREVVLFRGGGFGSSRKLLPENVVHSSCRTSWGREGAPEPGLGSSTKPSASATTESPWLMNTWLLGSTPASRSLAASVSTNVAVPRAGGGSGWGGAEIETGPASPPHPETWHRPSWRAQRGKPAGVGTDHPPQNKCRTGLEIRQNRPAQTTDTLEKYPQKIRQPPETFCEFRERYLGLYFFFKKNAKVFGRPKSSFPRGGHTHNFLPTYPLKPPLTRNDIQNT